VLLALSRIVLCLSQFMILELGDLINAGTPPGVGLGMKSPQFLADSDVRAHVCRMWNVARPRWGPQRAGA